MTTYDTNSYQQIKNIRGVLERPPSPKQSRFAFAQAGYNATYLSIIFLAELKSVKQHLARFLIDYSSYLGRQIC